MMNTTFYGISNVYKLEAALLLVLTQHNAAPMSVGFEEGEEEMPSKELWAPQGDL